MPSLRALVSTSAVSRPVFVAGFLLSLLGCAQTEDGTQLAPVSAPAVAPTIRSLTAATGPGPSVSHPGAGDLAGFAAALERKLDHGRESSRAASPGGGILNIPNGHVAHASVLVRGPDGKLHSACVSSPAEVSALLRRVAAGGGK